MNNEQKKALEDFKRLLDNHQMSCFRKPVSSSSIAETRALLLGKFIDQLMKGPQSCG